MDRKSIWAAMLYVVLGLVLGVLGGYLTILLLAVGTVLSLTLVGLPLIAGVLAGARGLGAAHRWLARKLLGEQVGRPHPIRPATGLFGRLRARLGDIVAWRAIAYLVAKIPVGLIAAAVLIVFVLGGLWTASYPIWWHWADPQTVHIGHGRIRRSGFSLGELDLDTWPRAFVVGLVGLLLLALSSRVLRAVLLLDRLLIRGLLGPVRLTERVRDLEETRARAVEDAAGTLRRIERDLHDGAQARLVSLAMSLTLVQDTLHPGRVDVARARELVDAAHLGAKEAIGELRDLVRGIHPPVLDQGLPTALRTLAARNALPVTASLDLPDRLPPAVETIGYFCVAELLTNATRHSGADRIGLEATIAGGAVRLLVRDDGVGGADPAKGSGLRGLAGRVSTIDGSLRVDSPLGGPTVIVVELPAGPSSIPEG